MAERSSAPVAALAMGAAAGMLAGLFGVGGGIIMVPLLVAAFGFDQRRASATSLLAIIPIGIASALGYAVNGNVTVTLAAVLVLGSVVGGQIGAWLLPRTPIHRLQFGFGLLSLGTAARLLLEDPATHAAAGSVSVSLTAVLLLVVVGLAGGVLAGLLGVGGGIIMVPALVILIGADVDVARGTSLAVLVVTAMTATVANVRRDLVAVPTGLLAGLGGVPGGVLGAWLGQVLAGRVALALFAALLVWSGVDMIRRSRRRGSTASRASSRAGRASSRAGRASSRAGRASSGASGAGRAGGASGAGRAGGEASSHPNRNSSGSRDVPGSRDGSDVPGTYGDT